MGGSDEKRVLITKSVAEFLQCKNNGSFVATASSSCRSKYLSNNDLITFLRSFTLSLRPRSSLVEGDKGLYWTNG